MTKTHEIILRGYNSEPLRKELPQADKEYWEREVVSLTKKALQRHAIVLGQTDVIVRVRVISGRT